MKVKEAFVIASKRCPSTKGNVFASEVIPDFADALYGVTYGQADIQPGKEQHIIRVFSKLLNGKEPTPSEWKASENCLIRPKLN